MDTKCKNQFGRNFIASSNNLAIKAYEKWFMLYPNVTQKFSEGMNYFLFNNKIKDLF